MILAIVGALFITGGIAAVVFVVQRRALAETEPYHPLFAESPDPDPVDARHDGYERAKYFTDEEAAQLQATATEPAVVADFDPDVSLLIGEIYGAFNAYRDGRDPFAGARREPSPEVKR